MYNIALDDTGRTLIQYQSTFLLIVNIANECGLKKQLPDLEKLHSNPKINCSVLAFPCNQFGSQQTLTSDEMRAWCESTYQTTFPIEDIVSVNGSHAHPVYKYLTRKARGVLKQQHVMWNFSKFLIYPQEQKIKRFSPQTSIQVISKHIQKLT